jgi:hypothetical protein
MSRFSWRNPVSTQVPSFMELVAKVLKKSALDLSEMAWKPSGKVESRPPKVVT